MERHPERREHVLEPARCNELLANAIFLEEREIDLLPREGAELVDDIGCGDGDPGIEIPVDERGDDGGGPEHVKAEDEVHPGVEDGAEEFHLRVLATHEFKEGAPGEVDRCREDERADKGDLSPRRPSRFREA